MVSKARGNKMALNKLVELVKEYTASVAPPFPPNGTGILQLPCPGGRAEEGPAGALRRVPGNCDCPHRRPFHHVC